MAESLQVDAHSLKPGFVDELEMALMEARLGEILPQRVIADYVHPAAHFFDLHEGIDLRGQATHNRAGNQGGKRQESGK